MRWTLLVTLLLVAALALPGTQVAADDTIYGCANSIFTSQATCAQAGGGFIRDDAGEPEAPEDAVAAERCPERVAHRFG